VDLIVTLNWRQGLGEECDWVPFFVFGQDLRKNNSGCEVGAVCFNVKGLGGIRGDEDQGHSDILLKPIEGQLFICSPMLFCVILGQVKEQQGMLREVLDEMLVEVSEA
jgi:hypothetical protein